MQTTGSYWKPAETRVNPRWQQQLLVWAQVRGGDLVKGWKGWVSTLVIVFISGCLTVGAAELADISGNWRIILIAGVTPVLTAIINALNKYDTRYGLGADNG